ncbi:dihydrolipoamide acetyltransferase family protein [Flavobacterium sp.]|jgi:2-oxoglutarate dehydrogenase E2 component (dihydrolipoamide succinyltransferase)|uniref:dihydrolipoamide acetyltransferase family protein n=1 Tax=Flavobacterium sp. TaxID=239 RepID=UPI0037C0453E
MFEFKMPKMGESILEATIINWTKNVGDYIEAEETLLEVATDKVDSEVPSPVSGIITEIRFQKDDVVEVGTVLALIYEKVGSQKMEAGSKKAEVKKEGVALSQKTETRNPQLAIRNVDAFLSPLIVSIAQKENLSIEELQLIPGSGAEGRLQKSDVFNYLKNRKYPIQSNPQPATRNPQSTFPKPKINFVEGKDRIVEMDRMRKMIADHMVYSKQTSPHVTSYIEVDVTNLVHWRNENKDNFLDKYSEKLTFTPIFIDAVAKAIHDFPLINVSVDEKNIIVHKDINIGMATALPTGNLIVTVVKNANEKNVISIAKEVNQLAENARSNKLKPEDTQGSTFTISNVGTFGSLMGTPIINQPEVAILALGIIKKRPEVITTSTGDEIAIRSMMYLSLSFDHRVVDGFLGGSFLRRVGDYLEQFDTNTTI